MAKQKFDGVVEAAHYAPDGQVEWVRVYERRGPTFSDRIVYDRKTFIEKLKAGKVFLIGQRIASAASTFELGWKVNLVKKNGNEYLSTADEADGKDQLAGVPRI